MRTATFSLLAACSLLAAASPAHASDDCNPAVLTAVDDDAFGAWLEQAARARSSYFSPAVRRQATERDAQCKRWLLGGTPDDLQRTLELPTTVPDGLACVPPEDAPVAVEVDDDLGPAPEATWLFTGGAPFVVLSLGLEPAWWSWDAERACAVTWPLQATHEPHIDETTTADDDDPAGNRETVIVARHPVTGGTLVLEASSRYEQSDWIVDLGRGCERSGTSWSHDASVRWTFESTTLPAPIELASTYDGDGMSDPDDSCEPWTRPGDGAVMVHHDGGQTTLGITDDQLAAHQAVCEATGSSRCSEKRLASERPAVERRVGNFFLDRHEVTRARYAACVEAGACAAIDESTCQIYDGEGWDDGRQLPEAYAKPDMPQLCVTRAEAVAYCAWVDARLPTEAEWEVAARDPWERRIFPWGNDWDAGAAVFLSGSVSFAPAEVGSHPDGHTPLGIADLAGNAYEWVAGDACALAELPDGWDPVPCELPDADAPKGVVRGGSFLSDGGALRTTSRKFIAPDARLDTNGFRCAADGADW